MRVRVRQMFYYDGKKHYHAGEVIDVGESQAKQWLAKGLVMEDKSLDGPSETKVESGIIPPRDPWVDLKNPPKQKRKKTKK